MSEHYMKAQIALQSGGACAQVCACLVSLACCAGGITFMVYLGKYAFNNPDPADVWAVETPGLALQLGQGADDAAVPVHDNFVKWFLWGLIQCLILPGGMCLAGVAMACVPALGACLGGLTGCAAGCGGLAWWITGIIWRFNRVGQFAAGDGDKAADHTRTIDELSLGQAALVQTSSGNFMRIYYLITWSMMAIMCGCTILFSLCGCIMAMCK